jgi:hypothetical protein
MANLGTAFITDDMPAPSSYEVLPAGWYTASIGNVEIKQTKSGTGRYFAIRYNITGPTHEGRVVFSNINFENANPKAEEIGRQQLRGLMEAIGLARLTDSDQLVGGHVKIKLKVEKDDQYGDKNQVTGFSSAGAAPPSAPKAAAAASSAPKASSAPPWAR